VVQAKRLSASKMGKLTEIAMKSMEVRNSFFSEDVLCSYRPLPFGDSTLQNDTQLVSILYRTHKSLPAAAKVSSLYAFDALARAARSQVNKHGLTGDINSEKGNCATFLLKIEGVLDGLFQDMIMAGSPETKVSSSLLTLPFQGRHGRIIRVVLPYRHCGSYRAHACGKPSTRKSVDPGCD
jgi:protein NRD1